MEKKSKGYWLFDRNGYQVHQGEAFLNTRTGNLLLMSFKSTLHFYRASGPFAIYKWVEPK